MHDAPGNRLDWDGLRLLLVLHDHRSLRAAARELGISQPTLGRKLRALDDTLGTPLVLRHARGVTFTEAGESAVAVARQMQGAVSGFQREVAGQAQEVAGRVRVACTPAVAQHVLVPSLPILSHLHERLGIDVVVGVGASDLDQREADIAIRMFPPRNPNLKARRVGRAWSQFYAAAAYRDRFGLPTTLHELMAHRLVAPDREALFLRQARAMGFEPSEAAFRTDDYGVSLSLVESGQAMAVLLGPVMRNGLIPVLEPLVEHPVWLVTHPDLWSSVPVRVVWAQLVDVLSDAFGKE